MRGGPRGLHRFELRRAPTLYERGKERGVDRRTPEQCERGFRKLGEAPVAGSDVGAISATLSAGRIGRRGHHN
jgi:hypothetical protein